MVQRRFVRVILLSKKKHLEEFVILEDCFLQDYHCTGVSSPCSANCKEGRIKSTECNNKLTDISKNNLEYPNENASTKIINEQMCISSSPDFCCSVIFFKRENPVHINYFLKMDRQLFSMFALELRRSPLFCKAVIDRLFEQYCNKGNAYKVKTTKCPSCSHIWENITTGIYLIWPRYYVMDKAGNWRIRMLVNERCEIENAMSWLSTLGGAYSSLGDEILYHAKQAQKVSLQQYRLALTLQDSLAVSRCKIYFAMSLVQQGYYKEAKRIIRKQYLYALTEEGRLDFRLANMCKAVWNKIRHLQNEAKQLE